MKDNHNRFEALVRFVCVERGWCGVGKTVDDFMPSSGAVSARDFAVWTILADDEEPFGAMSVQRGWVDELENDFQRIIGSNSIDVAEC
jgi:hypothetical protein